MIYLDNAATTLHKPPQVGAAMLAALERCGNAARGAHGGSLDAARVIYETREKLAALFRCPRADHVVFTANATQALNTALYGLLRPGDHVIATDLEHNSVLRPLYLLEREREVSVDFVRADPMGRIDYGDFEGLIRPETRAVVCTHASNVCGTVQPIAALGELCADRELLLIVDSAQTAGLFPLHMQEMRLAALAFTGHKTLLGPQGTGGFLLRGDLAKQMEPLISGGTGSLSHLDRMPDFMPDRFEAGTPNLPGLYGLYGALQYRKTLDPAALLRHELMLTERFLSGLRSIPRIRLIGREDTRDRAPVVSLQIRDGSLSEAALLLDSRWKIQARVGLHCAPLAHRALGTFPEGTLRFSFGERNTAAEVDICLRALEELCRDLPVTKPQRV